MSLAIRIAQSLCLAKAALVLIFALEIIGWRLWG